MPKQDIRFVAFLDVLGFSVLLQNNDIDYVNSLFEDVFQTLNDRNMVGESYSEKHIAVPKIYQYK